MSQATTFRPRPLEVDAPAPTRRSLREVAPREGWASRLFRRAGGTLIVVAILALFGLAGFHAVIVQQQRQVDQLSTDLRDALDLNETLRVELTELEAPERILGVAQVQLGMISVEPSDVVYLPAPSGELLPSVAAALVNNADRAPAPVLEPASGEGATTRAANGASNSGTSDRTISDVAAAVETTTTP